MLEFLVHHSCPLTGLWMETLGSKADLCNPGRLSAGQVTEVTSGRKVLEGQLAPASLRWVLNTHQLEATTRGHN